MKKVLLTLAGVALLAVVFSSCKKDCYCTSKVDGVVIMDDEQIPGLTTSAQCSLYEDTATMAGEDIVCDAR
jgi:hypothetical protein